MKYDFTSILDRRGKDAAAYDNVGAHVIAPARPKEGFDIIPMWVADMNFPVVPTITEAIIARAQHPSFGYFFPTDKYYDSIVQWHEKRNGVTGLTKEHIGYENGVLGGVVSALNVLCSRGDNVLVHSPTYSGFTSCLTNAGYSIVLSPLVQDEQGIWRMDFEDMEKKIVANHIHTALFCSPHNPTGRVWSEEELRRVADICARNGVLLFSDEIHFDFIAPGHRHTVLATLDEQTRDNCIVGTSASKTFNLAGLSTANIIIPNDTLRRRFRAKTDGYTGGYTGYFGLTATRTAYEKGEAWLDALLVHLEGNFRLCREFLAQRFPSVWVAPWEGAPVSLSK